MSSQKRHLFASSWRRRSCSTAMSLLTSGRHLRHSHPDGRDSPSPRVGYDGPPWPFSRTTQGRFAASLGNSCFSARARAWACRSSAAPAPPARAPTRGTTAPARAWPSACRKARSSSTPRPISGGSCSANGSAACRRFSTRTTTWTTSTASMTSARSAIARAARCPCIARTASSGGSGGPSTTRSSRCRCPAAACRRSRSSGSPPRPSTCSEPASRRCGSSTACSTCSASGSGTSPTAPIRTAFRMRRGPCSRVSTR